MPQAQVEPLFHQNTEESWGYLILSLSLLYQFLKKYSYNYSANRFRNRVLMNVVCSTFKQFYLLENCSLEVPTETVSTVLLIYICLSMLILSRMTQNDHFIKIVIATTILAPVEITGLKKTKLTI